VVVVDEVQMTADKTRGANLEFLLTLIRRSGLMSSSSTTGASRPWILSTVSMQTPLEFESLRVVRRDDQDFLGSGRRLDTLSVDPSGATRSDLSDESPVSISFLR
jgi:hypothetical protein